MTNQIWSLSSIKAGVERFISEHSRMPTARDFDQVPYLPTARQVQRSHGGLSALRETLGYGPMDFTKGVLRKEIAQAATSLSTLAEERLETVLVARFGEAFVHTQKRYGTGTRNRYDFFIYAEDTCLGIDIFTSGRPEYINTNVRHKISKYSFKNSVPVIFVAVGNFNNHDIARAVKGLPALKQNPHMSIMNEVQLMKYLNSLTPLHVPEGFKGTSSIEYEQK